MERDAFDLLRQIATGAPLDAALRDQWLDALQTIRWVCETDEGSLLTSEGREAVASFLALRRSREAFHARSRHVHRPIGDAIVTREPILVLTFLASGHLPALLE
jgi:hypothetical protein